ncbi:MAG TPA: hypothetical protein VGX51_13410 [Solirubrobacteraceae bacterium]|jgi:glucose-6-phosphate 1-dehydrogenase|nr:hypothetical protein [Solirubrobacteraceae bacterium]
MSTPAATSRRRITRRAQEHDKPQAADMTLVGDSKRFPRQDGVEECWRVMQPLLDSPPPVHRYAQGSWGPDAADQVLAGWGRWHEPWGVS